MRILGIDPGIHGGLSIVEIAAGAAPVLVECVDIPVIGSGAKERVDAIALRNWLSAHKPQHAYIERAQAMPRQALRFEPADTAPRWLLPAISPAVTGV